MTSDISSEASLSLSPNKGETAVRVYFLVLSAGHNRYALAHRGAVLKRTAVPKGHLFHTEYVLVYRCVDNPGAQSYCCPAVYCS